MVTVVTEGLRDTAVGASLVVRLTLKGMAGMSAVNVVDTSSHWVVVALEKVRSTDNEVKSMFTA